MKYQSTRSNKEVSASQAIIDGLASDGGLYVPTSIPKLNVNSLYTMKYQKLALEILKLYFNEFSDKDLIEAINNAYKDEMIEITSFEKYGYLELYHGKTAAFKDMALSLFPYLLLLAKEYQNINEDIFILSATSGDTGSAAMEAVKDIKGIEITVIYPSDGVSIIQEELMKKQDGDNIDVIAVEGNFDDAQKIVKEMFLDEEFNNYLCKNKLRLTSANSINIGRLVPQIIYYYASYVNLVNNEIIEKDEKINISVPTGNFGNILAAYLAREMGLPIEKLICCSNENNILSNFLENGGYDTNRDLVKTYSPSMDILISSNLERFLYFISDSNYQYISNKMDDLKEEGCFSIEIDKLKKINEIISYCTVLNEESLRIIKQVYDSTSYLMDPHTAIAYQGKACVGNDNYTLIAATASPYKFVDAVNKALDIEDTNQLDCLYQHTKKEIPELLKAVKDKEVKFTNTLAVSAVKKYLQKKKEVIV